MKLKTFVICVIAAVSSPGHAHLATTSAPRSHLLAGKVGKAPKSDTWRRPPLYQGNSGQATCLCGDTNKIVKLDFGN